MNNRIKGKRSIVWLVVLALLALQGCVSQAAAIPQSIPATQADTVVIPAPVIHSAEVMRGADTADIRLIIRAELSSDCYRLGSASVNRQGIEFIVTLPAEKVNHQSCNTTPINQDVVIRLTTQSLNAGNYVVLVNGFLSTFSIPVLASAAPAPVTAPTTLPTVVAGAAVKATSLPAVVSATPVAPTPVAPTIAPTLTPLPTQTPAPSAAPTVALPPSPTPTATPLSLSVGQDTSGCVNRAAFYGDLTVPDGTPFDTGAKFTKTWMVMNVGTCTWGSGYQLVLAGGDPLGAPLKLPLAAARPRQVVQISVDFTAPVAPQGYDSQWAFQTPQGYTFGTGNPGITPLELKIIVAARPAGLVSGLDCGALRLHDMELQVLDQINATRATYNLYPYTLREDISITALKHSLEMACYNRESHWGLDGNLYNVRLQRDNIAFATSNEMIYSGNGGPAGSINWWMHSPIHKPIVLSTKYTEIGIGFVFYDKNPYKQRITVDLIHP